MEVSQPNELEAYLIPYAVDLGSKGADTPQLYAQVPATIIRATVQKHLGLAPNSGNLPAMTEEESESDCESHEEETWEMDEEGCTVDEDGCKWAAAAEPPPEEETESGSDIEEEATAAEAEAAVHLGAIAPPPPLLQIEMSPIASQPTIPTTETPTFNRYTMNDLSEAVLHVDARDVFEAPTQEEIEEAMKMYPNDNNE